MASEIFLSEYALPQLKEHLIKNGHTLNIINDNPNIGKGIGSHADLTVFKTGVSPDSPVIYADTDFILPKYPENAAYCAVALDKYVIHRLDITAPEILNFTNEQGLIPINVRQGYTRCSCVVVDGSSVITADEGIFSVLKNYPDINVLKIRAGFVLLPEFEYGFIGGASGRVGNEIIFNGDVSRHPDFGAIKNFIISRGLNIKYFCGALTDIGSIIQYAPLRER